MGHSVRPADWSAFWRRGFGLVFTTLASATVIALPLLIAAPARAADITVSDINFAETSPAPVLPWLSIEAIAGYGENNDWAQSWAGATLFAPLAQDPSRLLFLQLDGRSFFDAGAVEGNAALGYRWIGDGVVYGVYGAYDGRYSANDNYIQQLGLGVEALGPTWDARANLYLPLTGAQLAPDAAEVVLSGSNIAMVGAYEVPLWGVDLEIGARLASSSDGNQELWGHVGGYYFDSWDMPIEDHVYGPQASAEYRFNNILGPQSRLSLVASAKWDAMRGAQASAGARLRIPLGGPRHAAPLDPLRSRLAERLVRDPDIVLGQSAAEPVKDALTEVVFDQVDYTATPGDLGADVGAAPDNTLLIVERDYDTFQTIDDAANITIAGEGGTFAIAGVNSGVVVDYTVPGARHGIAVEGTGGDATRALAIDNTGSGIGEGVHLVGLEVSATNDALGNGAALVAMSITGLTSPLYLEDMFVEARGALATPATDTEVDLTGLSIADSPGPLVIVDSEIGAALPNGIVGVESYDQEAFLYGLSSYRSVVDIQGSTLHASVDGGVMGAGGDYTGAHLYGLYAPDDEVDTLTVSNSDIHATLNGGVAGATDGQVSVDLDGLFAAYVDTLSVTNSNIHASLNSDVTTPGDDAWVAVVGLVGENVGTLAVSDSTIYASLDGDVSGTQRVDDDGLLPGTELYGLYASGAGEVTISSSTIYGSLDGDVLGVDDLNTKVALYGVYKEVGTLAVSDSTVYASLGGGVTANASGDVTAELYGLSAASVDAVDVSGGSAIHASLDGGVTSNSSGSSSAGLFGLHADDIGAITLSASSTVSASLEGGVAGTSSGLPSAALFGIHASDTGSLAVSGGSMVLASLDGGVTGGNKLASAAVYGLFADAVDTATVSGSSIHASLDGGVESSDDGPAGAALFGLHADDSTIDVSGSDIAVAFAGDVSAGTKSAIASLAIVDYTNAPGTLPDGYDYALSITDSDLSIVRDGTELNGGVTTTTGISLSSTSNPAPVRLSDDRFAGAFDGVGIGGASNNLVFISDQNYDFGTVSTGNTATGAMTNTPLCSQDNTTWEGSFEVDGVTYDATGSGTNIACAGP